MTWIKEGGDQLPEAKYKINSNLLKRWTLSWQNESLLLRQAATDFIQRSFSLVLALSFPLKDFDMDISVVVVFMKGPDLVPAHVSRPNG